MAYSLAENYAEAEKAMRQAVTLDGTDEYRTKLDELKKLVPQTRTTCTE